MKTYTANALIRCVLNTEGNIGAAIQALDAEVECGHKLRLETVLDAARGVFDLRDAIPSAASWAMRLCDYTCKPEHQFHPIWRAVALKVSLYEKLGDIPNATRHYDQLVAMGDASHEAAVVAERLYQSLCQHEQFWAK
ncbi:MAG: hypothetical protein ACKVOE_04460 [Rickettsiales bacterium]